MLAALVLPAVLVWPVSAQSSARWQSSEYYNLAKDVQYSSLPGSSRQALDLYLPRLEKGPFPLVVWIHGGGWAEGDKANCPAVPLLRDHLAVASINYRLTDEASFPAQIYDCKAAIRYLRANAARLGLDPQRIAVWGASAGGHLSALLGTTSSTRALDGSLGNNDTSSAVQAVVDWCGPASFLIDGKPLQLPCGSMVLVQKFLGGSIDQKRAQASAASPVSYISGKEPPFLIMHGAADDVVPVEQSVQLAETLKAKKNQVQLMIIPGSGHHLLSENSFAQVRAFLLRCLGKH